MEYNISRSFKNWCDVTIDTFKKDNNLRRHLYILDPLDPYHQYPALMDFIRKAKFIIDIFVVHIFTKVSFFVQLDDYLCEAIKTGILPPYKFLVKVDYLAKEFYNAIHS